MAQTDQLGLSFVKYSTEEGRSFDISKSGLVDVVETYSEALIPAMNSCSMEIGSMLKLHFDKLVQTGNDCTDEDEHLLLMLGLCLIKNENLLSLFLNTASEMPFAIDVELAPTAPIQALKMRSRR